MISKKAVLEEIQKILRGELMVLTEAAKAAHHAATHEESRAEDSHDTRAIESSYLAGAQAERAAVLQRTLDYFRHAEVRDGCDVVAPFSLVELKSSGKKFFYLIATMGGGIRVEVEGRVVQVLTAQSPLGEELLGRRVGECVEIEAQSSMREYEVVGVF